MKRTKLFPIFFALVGLTLPGVVNADLVWRVSVKVVLDENGNWPSAGDLNTEAKIIDRLTAANLILGGHAATDVPTTEVRGYLLEWEDPIATLSGLPAPPTDIRACSNNERLYCTIDDDCDGGTCERVDSWFDAPIARAVYDEIAAQAMVDENSRELWGWRDDAINIYILGQYGSGLTGGSSSDATRGILLGQDLASENTPFHEIGHFLDLRHTHGGGGASPSCDYVGDDYVDDTLGDSWFENRDTGEDCIWQQDDIAKYNFPTSCSGGPCAYNELSSDDQFRVDQTFFNLMTLRPRREVLTPGQLDRMTDFSNNTMSYVASGKTHFVDTKADPAAVADGSSVAPYTTIEVGVANSNRGDIVLIRSGTYNESLLINKQVTMRASRGLVAISRP